MGCNGSKAAPVREPGPEPTQAPKRPKAANGRDRGVDTEPAELAVSAGWALGTAAAPALAAGGEGGAWEQEAAELEAWRYLHQAVQHWKPYLNQAVQHCLIVVAAV